MEESSGTLNVKLTILLLRKSYNLDDHPTTLSTITDTGMGEGSGPGMLDCIHIHLVPLHLL